MIVWYSLFIFSLSVNMKRAATYIKNLTPRTFLIPAS
jgi:hypothetical protein